MSQNLEQEMNLSRRACWYSTTASNSLQDASADVVGDQRPPLHSTSFVRSRSSLRIPLNCVLLVLLGVLLFGYPVPSLGRPNGTSAVASGWQDSQPNVSTFLCCQLVNYKNSDKSWLSRSIPLHTPKQYNCGLQITKTAIND